MDREKYVSEQAAASFLEGYNCAESIFRTFNHELKFDLSKEMLKIATGFGAGLGQAGCMCGALAASIMVLNLLQGRTRCEESRAPAYMAAKEFHAAFTEQFGTTCCRALNPHEFGSSAQKENCVNTISKTAGLLLEFITDFGLERT